jgi:hypothetical protein
MMRTQWVSGFGGAMLAAATLGAGEIARAQDELEDAQLFFELNDTDGDIGIHLDLEGDEWRSLKIKKPGAGTILNIRALNALGRQGLSEIGFESAEPELSELPIADFLARFPEGTYTFKAKTIDGETLVGESELSHVLPAAPGNVQVSGVPASTDCDAVVPVVAPPIVISWDAVTSSHPTLGTPGAVAIASYELALELEFFGEEFDSTTLLPPTVTSFPVSDALLAVFSGPYEFEVLARDANGNRTIFESCFDVP